MTTDIKPESSAGGWDRYVGDHFSKIIERDGHRICLAVDRSGVGYRAAVVDYDGPTNKSVFIIEGDHGLTRAMALAERFAQELML